MGTRNIGAVAHVLIPMPSTHLHLTLPETKGAVINWGWRYDLMVSVVDLVTLGRLRQIRRLVLDVAELSPGASVLDVGCGTGTLALEAYQRVGPAGRVVGIDPGPRQIDRARTKAARRGVEVHFQIGAIERLPFTDASFDAVLSTLMMHHLPDDLKRVGLAEIARVLKPGGRLLVADADHPHLHPFAPHRRLPQGSTGVERLQALLADARLGIVKSIQVPITRLPAIPRVGIILARKAT